MSKIGKESNQILTKKPRSPTDILQKNKCFDLKQQHCNTGEYTIFCAPSKKKKKPLVNELNVAQIINI